MPGGRKAPALFELLGEAKGVTPKVPTPVSVPAPPPPAVLREAKPLAAERPAPAPPPPAVPEVAPGLDRRVALPVSWIYLGVAGVLLTALIIWAVAFRTGASAERAKADRQLGAMAGTRAQDRPVDPLKPEQIPLNPNLVTSRTDTPPPTVAKPSEPARPAGSGPTPVPAPATAAGFGVDPRQSGLNYYLVEGKLDRESAEKIHAFLNASGVPAFAVVDDRGGAANNPPLYLVGVSRGFTRDDLRGPAKAELENQIRTLGRAWQTQHRGTTDFSRTGWERRR